MTCGRGRRVPNTIQAYLGLYWSCMDIAGQVWIFQDIAGYRWSLPYTKHAAFWTLFRRPVASTPPSRVDSAFRQRSHHAKPTSDHLNWSEFGGSQRQMGRQDCIRPPNALHDAGHGATWTSEARNKYEINREDPNQWLLACGSAPSRPRGACV